MAKPALANDRGSLVPDEFLRPFAFTNEEKEMLKDLLTRRRMIAWAVPAAAFVLATDAVSSARTSAKQDSLSELEKIVAMEDIKKVKAKYFRFVDTKRWDDLQALFTRDATWFFPEYYPPPRKLAESINTIRETGAVSVHQGCMPQIEILSPTVTEGIGGMSDHLWLPPGDMMKVNELIGAGLSRTIRTRQRHLFDQDLKIDSLAVEHRIVADAHRMIGLSHHALVSGDSCV